MIVVTSNALEFVLGGSVTANQLTAAACYRLISDDSYNADTALASSNDTTDVAIVSVPGPGSRYVVDLLVIRNEDTANATVTLKYDDDTVLWEGTLKPNESLVYAEGAGFSILDPRGNPVAPANKAYSYGHVTTGTSTVKSGAGIFKSLILNNHTLNDVVTVYDNTAGSGTVILQLPAGAVAQQVIELNCAFSTGLTVVLANAADDVTVIYE